MNLDSSAFVADDTLVQMLRRHAVPVDCSEDCVLFHQGDEPIGLFILHSGQATMCIQSPAGDEVVTMPAAPGSLMGLPGLVANRAYSMSAFAKKGASISFLSRDEFGRLMLSEPTLAVSILRVLAAEVRTARVAMANA